MKTKPQFKLPWKNCRHVLMVFAMGQSSCAAAIVSVDGGAAVEVIDTLVHPLTGHSYHLISGAMTPENPMGGLSWSGADSFAKSLSRPGCSSHLVSINSASEGAWLRQNLLASYTDVGERHQVVWIGLHDRQSEGDFVWENGDDFHHSEWGPALPVDRDGIEDFAYITNTVIFDPFVPLGTWNDYQDQPMFYGNLPFSAIVEVQPVPEPSSSLFLIVVIPTMIRRRR